MINFPKYIASKSETYIFLQNQAKAVVNEIFPMEETSPQVDSALDLVAIKVSLDLIDDIPSKDPRWADVKSAGMTSLRFTTTEAIGGY